MGNDRKLLEIFSLFKTVSPKVLSLPFVKGIIDTGAYVTQSEEPSIFTTVENGINTAWMCWFLGFVLNGDMFAGRFINHPSAIAFPGEVERSGKCVYLWLDRYVKAGLHPLPKEPPKIKTEHGGLISQAWILDTCKRDNMTPQEAYQLAIALTK